MDYQISNEHKIKYIKRPIKMQDYARNEVNRKDKYVIVELSYVNDFYNVILAYVTIILVRKN